MNSPASNDVGPTDHVTVVRFVVPDSLLVALRERRARWRADRAGSRGAGLVTPLPSLSDGTDVSAVAQACVQAMNDLQMEVEQQYDASLLDPGMGPMTYLAADGRIIIDGRPWDGEGLAFETSLDNTIAALVVGAKKTKLSELLAIIPRLDMASTCPKCCGKRWTPIAPTVDIEVVCLVCAGRGEVDARLLSRAKAAGVWQ